MRTEKPQRVDDSSHSAHSHRIDVDGHQYGPSSTVIITVIDHGMYESAERMKTLLASASDIHRNSSAPGDPRSSNTIQARPNYTEGGSPGSAKDVMKRNDSSRQGITTLTLSWESLDFLPRLIDSTLEWADLSYILDTGSTDGSREYLLEHAATDQRLWVSFVDTDHHSFNRRRRINMILDQIDSDLVRSDWFTVIDCDEVFLEDDPHPTSSSNGHRVAEGFQDAAVPSRNQTTFPRHLKA